MSDSGISSRLDELPCELRGKILSLALRQTAWSSVRAEVVIVIRQGKLQWTTGSSPPTSINVFGYLVDNLSPTTYEQFIEMICPGTRFHFQDSESFHALVQSPIESTAEEAGGDLCLRKKLHILRKYTEMISCCFSGAINVDAFLRVLPRLRQVRLCPWYHRSHSNEKNIVEHQGHRDQGLRLEIQYDPTDAWNKSQMPTLRRSDLQGSGQVGGAKTRKAKKGAPRSKVKRLRACGERTYKRLENRCFSHSLEKSSPVGMFLDDLDQAITRARLGGSASNVVSILVCCIDEYRSYHRVPEIFIHGLHLGDSPTPSTLLHQLQLLHLL